MSGVSVNYSNQVFLAEADITSVYIKPKPISSGLSMQAATVDVLCVTGSRGPIPNIRLFMLNWSKSGGRYSGWFKIPEVGDRVIVAWIEGLAALPIAITGLIPFDTVDGIPEEFGYFQDGGYMHTSGSFIRFRNLESSSTTPPTAVRSEIIIGHINGDTITIAEPTSGSTTIEITHNKGASIGIDVDGNITLNVPSGKLINLGNGAIEPAVLGNAFLTWASTHIHPTGVGPSGVASPAPTASLLSQIVKVK